jgi:hypothetical protein
MRLLSVSGCAVSRLRSSISWTSICPPRSDMTIVAFPQLTIEAVRRKRHSPECAAVALGDLTIDAGDLVLTGAASP